MGINFKNCRSKKTFSLLLVIGILLALNVSIFAWQSDNGNGTFTNPPLFADYPDPSIIRVGNDFYFASTTFVNVPGCVILHSQDLVNWEIISHCISSLPSGGKYDMNGALAYAGGCFAPGLAYYNGTFYVALNLNGDGGTYIYYATNPAGPWNHYQLSGSYFDPCLFFDNGIPYLVWGGAWENSIKMIQLNSNLSGTTGSQTTILSYKGVEGSHLVKANGYYYLFNAVPGSLSMVCSRSATLKGPYSGTNTVLSDGNSGAHQGGIVDMPDGGYWGYAMKDSGSIGRVTYICPISWSNNWPVFGNSGKIASSYTKPIANKPVMVPATSDEFNGSALGLQWMWNHNPDNSKWSLTGSALRLRATTASDFWHARNSLTQKGQGQTSSGGIKIDCSAMQSGDIMGLGMLGNPKGYIAVTKDSTGKKIIMTQDDSVKATVSNITDNILYFRIEMNFSTNQAKFFWKNDTMSSWSGQIGPAITMGYDWQHGTFQGEQYAILCFNPGSSSGYMDVDWFRFNDQTGPDVSPTPTPTLTPTPTPVGSYVRFHNVATGLYIDGMGSTANGSNACQWGNSNSANQQWTIINSGSYVMIQNRASGLYLDGMGRTSNGSVCGQWSYSGSANQQWTQETSGSYVRFKNGATGLYLDGMGSTGNGSNLCQWSNSGSANQQWQIQ